MSVSSIADDKTTFMQEINHIDMEAVSKSNVLIACDKPATILVTRLVYFRQSSVNFKCYIFSDWLDRNLTSCL